MCRTHLLLLLGLLIEIVSGKEFWVAKMKDAWMNDVFMYLYVMFFNLYGMSVF